MYFPLNYFSNKYSNSHNFIIHLKISFLSHNKERKSYSIFHFFFLPNFRIPTTPLSRRRIATNEATVRKKKRKKRRVCSWNVYEFKWTRSFRVPVDRFKLSDRFRGKPRYRVTNTRNPLTRKYISGCDSSSRASSNLNKLDPSSVYLC